MWIDRAQVFAAAAIGAFLLAGCPMSPSTSQDVSFLEQFSPPPDATTPPDTNPGARRANLLDDLAASIATGPYSGDLAVSASNGSAISTVAPTSSQLHLPAGETLAEFFGRWTSNDTAPPATPVNPLPPPPLPPPPVHGPPGTVYSGYVAGISREILVDAGEANIPDQRQMTVAFDPDSGVLTSFTIPGNILIPDVQISFGQIGDSVTRTGTASGGLTYSVSATLTTLQIDGSFIRGGVALAVSARFGAATHVATGIHTFTATRAPSQVEFASTTRYSGTLSASAENQPSVSIDFIQELTLAGILTAE